MSRFGVNGNFHSVGVDYFDDVAGLAYNGDGDWSLPTGYSVNGVGADDWMLIDDEGVEWHVWTEE